MGEQNFIDYVKIYFRSGRGGAGAVHFRREKYVPRGGPDGGDGGRGGNIYLRGNAQMWTLLPYRYTRHIIAEDGQPGRGKNQHGASGKDIYVDVPIGTIARDADTGKVLCEILHDGQTCLLLKGGRGGLGNVHFKSPTRQAPRYAQPGEEGEERWIILELKLLADVGLVGFPNAGKSTLLATLSAAKPKIADYPFTTLTPQLGIVPYREYKSFVMADIPGIIEGAHKGKGLGLQFLRHIERNSILLFMVPADADDIVQQFHTLENELRQYNPELLHKDRLYVVSKSDLLDDELKREVLAEIPPQWEPLLISSITGEGLETLKDRIWKKLHAEK